METLKPLRLVSIADPALDWPAMAVKHSGNDAKYASAIQEYTAKRYPEMVCETPGRSLTWFTIRRLDADIMDLVLSQDNDHYKHRAAFKYAVTRIDNLSGLDGQVYSRLEAQEERMVGGVPMPYLSEEHMRLIAPQYVEEIGGVAFQRSFLAPTNEVCFLRPRSWELLLKTKAAQVAADAVRKISDEDKRRLLAGDTKGSSGESATDAPATGKATSAKTSRSTTAGAPSKRRKRPSKRSKK